MSSDTFEIMARKKGTDRDFEPMPGIRVTSLEDAKNKIRARSDVVDQAFDLGIRTTTFVEFSERLKK